MIDLGKIDWVFVLLEFCEGLHAGVLEALEPLLAFAAWCNGDADKGDA